MPKKTIPYSQIFSAHPVTGSKGLAFAFDGLAKTLSDLAWNPHNPTPFTVVIRGGWGRGKTTLLRRTKGMLDEDRGARQVRTVWFNAWKYPNEDGILAGLLGAVLDEFRRGNMLDQLKFHIDDHKTGLARSVLHAAAPWAFGAPGDAKSWRGRYDAVEQKRAFNDQFRDLFVQASYLLFHGSAALRDTACRQPEELWDRKAREQYALCIFIDDLDRCRQERILEVLEAINLFLDLPGVCFFLGLDSERLLDLLPPHLEEHKEEFLEKIVQISLDLPEINERSAGDYVHSLIENTPLNAVLKGDGFDDTDHIAGLLGSRHPRHIKRFLNDLTMSLAVLDNTDRLGDEPPGIPERAVVAWHLLRESVPSEQWREIRALTANLDVFIRTWLSTAEQSESEKHPEGWGDDLLKLQREGVLDTHIEILCGLDAGQKDMLVHAASPPRKRKTPARPDSIGIDWVEIPAGRFSMGSDNGGDDEKPVHKVELPGFRIARYPVTNAQYATFVQETERRPPRHWKNGAIPEGKERHPVVNVVWGDAVACCRWLSDKLALGKGRIVTPPSEAEWEYAARGQERREYPWGPDLPTQEYCNFGGNVGDTTPVGAYP